MKQEEVSQILLEKFCCVPTFLPSEIHNRFYHGFCKHYLWPLFHYMLPVSPSQGARFDRSQWQAYVLANKIFADKVTEVINQDEDYVWVHDWCFHVLGRLDGVMIESCVWCSDFRVKRNRSEYEFVNES